MFFEKKKHNHDSNESCQALKPLTNLWYFRIVGSFFMVGGGRTWVKCTPPWLDGDEKKLKLHRLKCHKTVPKNKIWIKKWLIKNLIFVSLSTNFWFSARKYQSQQKIAKKITHFTVQFCSKNFTHFSTHSTLWKIYSHNTAYKHISEKTFALHHF